MTREERIAALKREAKQRILILDGAMGTMIQRYKLDEAGYRGTRFKGFSHDLKGNNDLLVLTQPKIIKEIKAMLGLSLVDSKKFVESAPKLMKEGVPKEEAEKMIELMKSLGAVAKME